MRVLLLGVALLAASCAKTKKPHAEAPPVTTATVAAQATTSAAPAPSAPVATKPEIPTTRSAVPTADEWEASQTYPVDGAAELGCDGKIIREWLRVSCRGSAPDAGAVTTLRAFPNYGGRDPHVPDLDKETFVYEGAGVASVVLPVVARANVKVDFSWANERHELYVQRTNRVAVYFDLRASEPFVATPAYRHFCDCWRKVTKRSNCDDELASGNEDCERTYGRDCIKIIECNHFEPSAPPACLPGFRYLPFSCQRVCKTNAQCEAGLVCDPDNRTCVPP